MSREHKYYTAIFALFVFVNIVHCQNECLTKFCGKNKNLPIRYPFKLEGGKNQQGCAKKLAINLKCNNQESIPVLSLPFSGDFYVRNINYLSQTIQLYDPNNCLPGRIMNSNFSSSPLTALNHENYTFFSCPSNFTNGANFTAIGCLSNPIFSIVATSSILRAQEMNMLGCNMIMAVHIPVSSPFQYEYNGFKGDLTLTWNIPACKVCLSNRSRNIGGAVIIIVYVLVIPNVAVAALFGLVVLILYCKRLIKRRLQSRAFRAAQRSDQRAQAASIPRQIRLPVVPSQACRIDIGSVMNTIVVGESRRVPGPNSITCPICLEDYNPRDTIKCSTKCEHYFHAKCIDLWLRTHNSCPVCRNATT